MFIDGSQECGARSDPYCGIWVNLMKKRPIVFIVLFYLIILLIALVVIAVMVFGRVKTLTNESMKIASMDISSDSVDMTIRSNGKYAVVEKTIKEYMNEYVADIQKFSGLASDDQMAEMLGTENMIADAPEFINSKAYLEDKRTESKELAEKLTEMGTQAAIDRTFADTGLNFFMKRVYNNQMYNNISLDFFYPAREIQKALEQLIQIFDSKEAVLDFLAENKNRWHFDGNMIEFESEELLAEYKDVIEGQ